MTYYNSQVIKIREEHIPNEHTIKQLINARKFIDENYCESISLQLISGSSFLSKFHFARLFKQAYGQTPHQYITDKRMMLAKHLLSTDVPVTETCFRIGFESQPSFSAAFKKYSGFTPSGFKNSNFQYVK